MLPTLPSFFDELTLPELRAYLANLGPLLEHLEEQENVVETAAEEKDVGEVALVNADVLNCVIDLRAMVDRPKRKWYTTNTYVGDRTGSSRLTKKKGVCFHHTAVRGGFGADKAWVAEYLEEGTLEMNMARFLVKPIQEMSPELYANALALAHRYRGDPARKYNSGAPYHVVGGANRVLYLNLPFDWVTWHGNGANTDFLGFGWDALSTEEEPAAEDLRADLKWLIELGRDEGHPLEEFTAHCCWTNKPSDPGPQFIEQVMVPVAEEMGIVIDWEFKAKNKRGARSLKEVLHAA